MLLAGGNGPMITDIPTPTPSPEVIDKTLEIIPATPSASNAGVVADVVTKPWFLNLSVGVWILIAIVAFIIIYALLLRKK